MANTSVMQFKEFSDTVFAEKGNKCWFCGEESRFCFYLLSYKNHKQDKLYLHPDKAAFYYPVCQPCMQTYVRARDKYTSQLIVDGVSMLQVEQYLAKELQTFLDVYERYDITGFKMFVHSLVEEKAQAGFVPNYDDNPIIQLLPSISSKLNASEIQFFINRVKQYQNDFMFNESSDYIILMNIILSEIQIQRLQSQILSLKTGQDGTKLKNELIATTKDYRENCNALGITRKDRDKVGGANIAEISTLIGDENEARLEIEVWDNEMEEMLKGKKVRDEALGYYEGS